jgi:peptidoglycan/LPS O-acetylase OafA/YrhL
MGTDKPASPHLLGIDSLRFVAAMWVALGHGAWLPVRQLAHGSGALGSGALSHAVSAVNDLTFIGAAPVIIFFVVSGLCIHLPYVGAERIGLGEYFARRYLRIGGPLVAILLFAHYYADPAAQAVHEVLWSVYCELAYYTLYPILFLAFRRYGIRPIIAIATAVALCLIAARWSFMWHWEFGLLTFLVGYPSWLLGCLLAEKIKTNSILRISVPIWYWRGAAWLYSLAATLLVYHSPVRIGNPATLLPFSFYCFFWIQQEVVRWREKAPRPWLEAAGAWSFSLYLVHKIVIAEFVELQLPVSPLANWALQLAALLALSYLYYLVIERPSHHLARRLGRFLRRPVAAPAVV